MTSDIDANKTAIRTYIETVVGCGRLELIDEIAHPDMQQVDLEGQSIAKRRGWPDGREGLRRHVEEFLNVFPDLVTQVEELVAEQDRVVLLWRAIGTHSAPFVGVQPTGKKAVGYTSSHFQMRDGMIYRYKWVFGTYHWKTAGAPAFQADNEMK